MLARKAKLIETEEWDARIVLVAKDIETGALEGDNQATEDWLDAARSNFSALNFKNKVDFSYFEFPVPKRYRVYRSQIRKLSEITAWLNTLDLPALGHP